MQRQLQRQQSRQLLTSCSPVQSADAHTASRLPSLHAYAAHTQELPPSAARKCRLPDAPAALQALEVAQAGEASNPEACLQLQAQLHYRLHQCRESIQAYDRLFKEHKVWGSVEVAGVWGREVWKCGVHGVPCMRAATALGRAGVYKGGGCSVGA